MLDIAFILGTTLMYATPLIFAALGGVMSERAGVVNIGIEGMMMAGCFTGAAVAYFSGNAWLGFLGAAVAGMLIALLHAIVTVRFSGDQVVSGIAINMLGPAITIFISKLIFDGATSTPAIENTMPKLLDGLFKAEAGLFSKNSALEMIVNQNVTTYIALLLVLVLWFVLYRTRAGLRIRAIGEHPRAAATLGIKVNRYKYLCILLSGALAGLGGAAVSLGIVSSFRPGLISGQGFIALAAVIFGRWTPQGSLLACLLFGVSNGLVIYLGLEAPFISPELLSMLPYVLTLGVLVLTVAIGKQRSSGAEALGDPYESDN